MTYKEFRQEIFPDIPPMTEEQETKANEIIFAMLKDQQKILKEKTLEQIESDFKNFMKEFIEVTGTKHPFREMKMGDVPVKE